MQFFQLIRQGAVAARLNSTRQHVLATTARLARSARTITIAARTAAYGFGRLMGQTIAHIYRKAPVSWFPDIQTRALPPDADPINLRALFLSDLHLGNIG